MTARLSDEEIEAYLVLIEQHFGRRLAKCPGYLQVTGQPSATPMGLDQCESCSWGEAPHLIADALRALVAEVQASRRLLDRVLYVGGMDSAAIDNLLHDVACFVDDAPSPGERGGGGNG